MIILIKDGAIKTKQNRRPFFHGNRKKLKKIEKILSIFKLMKKQKIAFSFQEILLGTLHDKTLNDTFYKTK